MPEAAILDRPGARLMRAAVVSAPGRIEVVTATAPEPGPGEVRIRLEGCGVCASNLTPWQGSEWMAYPLAPGGLGHEGWGLIDAVGPLVTGLEPGDRVATLSQHSYAEYDVAPADAVVKLPAALGSTPFPGEPLGCAMNIFRRAEISGGQTVAIIGIGFLGAILTRLASAAGARVIAVSRRRFSLELARRMGAEEAVPMEDHGAIIEAVRGLTGGRMCERVIEAVGAQWPLDLAAELCAERARLVIAGYHQDGPRQVNMQLWNWRGLDVINAHERDPAVYAQGVREAIAATAAGLIDPAALITHAYPLEALDAALDATRDRPDGFLKAVVRFP